MFYIDTKLRSWLRKDIAIGHIGPTMVVFAAFVGLTIWTSVSAKRDLETQQKQILTQKIDENKREIDAKLNTYEDILRASKGLFSASNQVTRDEWKEFINSFEIEKRYSGMQVAGYAKVIKSQELQKHIESVQSSGLDNYSIRPAGNRPVYVSLQYVESANPSTSNSQNSIGLDIYTDEPRRRAMDLARDSGQPAITDLVPSLKSYSEGPNKALVIYMPIYSGSTRSISERRKSIDGFVFFGFLSENLINERAQNQNDIFGFQVYDGMIKEGSLLYESPAFSSVNSKEDTRTVTEVIEYANQQWSIVGAISSDVISERDRAQPASILWGGILFSVFMAGFIYLLLLNRSRVTFEEEQREVQEAKNELLALASHQLRTPATGVKQYIGLLRDGYAGKLNREQKKYVDKAYENNERQLGTINKMLFVARANANKIDLRLERFDIKEMLKSIINDLMSQIDENDQKVKIMLPAKKTYITADSKFLRMGIENIVHNASKYTPEKGRITLRLKKTKQTILIEISDTGVGVDEKDYPLLFRKFSRIPNEFTNKVNGSGIGLYLSRKVIEAHGGTIDFQSKLGKGTTFTINLPFNNKQ